MPDFNLNDIFRNAFGYEVPEKKFVIPPATNRVEVSRKGLPFYGKDDSVLSGAEFFLPVTLDGMLIPFAVVGVTWKKTIVSTPLVERRGSVKELINIDDYAINIKGILMSEDNTYPDEQIENLYDKFKKNESLTLINAFTGIFLEGDDKVVIKEIKWPAVAGVEHAKPFEMELESDLVYTLEVG